MGRRVTPQSVDPIYGQNANVLKMPESELMEATLQLAKLLQWRGYHTRSSKGSEPGFPDWVALRYPRLLVVEFKADRGVVSDAQHEWLQEWGAFAGAVDQAMTADQRRLPTAPEVTVAIWTPADWINRTIHRELERRK